MKKLLVSLLLCSLMLSLAACDSNPSSPSSSAGDSSLPTESMVSEPEESLPGGSENGDSSNNQEESSITGTIKEVTDEAIMLETTEGTQLSIPLADVDTSELTDGLSVDTEVTVYYTGLIEDTDTSNIIVNRIVPAE